MRTRLPLQTPGLGWRGAILRLAGRLVQQMGLSQGEGTGGSWCSALWLVELACAADHLTARQALGCSPASALLVLGNKRPLAAPLQWAQV